jgi:hypothetical protein
MPLMTLYEEVENLLSSRLKNALRTREVINAPDWLSDLAHALALVVVLVDDNERSRLEQLAHEELDRFQKQRGSMSH